MEFELFDTDQKSNAPADQQNSIVGLPDATFQQELNVMQSLGIVQPLAEMKKKKRIRKKKVLRVTHFANIEHPFESMFNHVAHVYGDIYITGDRQIRLGGAVAWGVIGIEFMKGTRVITNEETVEVEMEYSGIQRVTFDEAISMISKTNSPTHKKFIQGFMYYKTFIDCKRSEAIVSPMPWEEQELQYESFCRRCWDSINTKKLKSDSLFGYTIGRCNYSTGIGELKHMGYSKGFLNLLCLNADVLQQMYLRNKPINLFFDREQMQELSLAFMENRLNQKNNLKTRVKITTIDGYDLYINQTMEKTIDFPENGRDHFFFMNVSRFDVDLEVLEGLIEYRMGLAVSKGMSFDKLIQVELSHMLEDVEYSVQSLLFLERYCQKSLAELTELKRELNAERKCGYRRVN